MHEFNFFAMLYKAVDFSLVALAHSTYWTGKGNLYFEGKIELFSLLTKKCAKKKDNIFQLSK
ncbi:hypothetical protein CHH80_09920 [Bacillus sp. 7504-2]|nr:hypothetical protein CHH80_09920 [Bacillus sp. 7504-2]